jgi:hypothetical protein
MGIAYTARLEEIRGEFAAAKAAISRLLLASTPARVAVSGVRFEDLEAAFENVEDTYFLRLTAETESVLRVHLTTHFPNVHITNADGFYSLVNRAAKNLDPTNLAARIPAHIVDPVRDLRPHRNDQAHGNPRSERRPRFNRALGLLSSFVFQLP